MANAACVEHDTVPCITLAPPIEVLLVDDQRAILAGVTALIESEGPSMRVAGQATTSRQAIDQARAIQPDVIILDVDLGGENGLDLIPMMLAGCMARIVVFTGHAEPMIRNRALALGAYRLVPKTAPAETLIAAILDAAE